MALTMRGKAITPDATAAATQVKAMTMPKVSSSQAPTMPFRPSVTSGR